MLPRMSRICFPISYREHKQASQANHTASKCLITKTIGDFEAVGGGGQPIWLTRKFGLFFSLKHPLFKS